ncbi:hypothetical protein N781_03025 [Pontibacillus halophilus JSM 076056 = DSM 19796]|uniref:HAMP domain-containing protein n=1 Tax=Pontibacillus halophilus JSM 076056 = DSM 19796 TaxID=1385510 RepID=A0A0A5GLI4_9BACI|nr:sensor histidine kinase [Pontibacillus halophilus]KGX92078.1 hypothetical protein N781_03025 [Pontibacillus halophilus JSM 076056 = DSM 19796]
MRVRSIQSKLLVVIVLFVCTPLLVFGYIWYSKTTKAIEENSVQSSQQLLIQTKEYLKYYLEDLEKATVPITTHPSVQRFLLSDAPPPSSYQQYLQTQSLRNEVFEQLFHSRADVYGVSLINQAGRQAHHYGHVKEFINMNEIYERNKVLWDSRNQFTSFDFLGVHTINGTPVITITHQLYNPNTYSPEGMLILHLRLKQIATIMNEGMMSHFHQIWVVNEKREIIYHPNTSQVGLRFPFEILANDDRYVINSYDHKENRTLMVYESLPEWGWTVVASVPLKESMFDLIQLRTFSIMVGLAIIGSAIVFVGGFSFSLTYSLRQLQSLMKQVATGDLKVKSKRPLPFHRNDEVSDLYNSFYSMTGRLSSLIDEIRLSKVKEQELQLKTKEAELQAMQSQINPHFLYNTLEVINSYAIIEKQPTISRMTTSLADMFRYNVSNTKRIVTLQEEIQQIRAYFAIQMERFEELQVMYDLEGNMKEVMTARLTLQPLIENAFVHGYEEHALSPEFIGVYGRHMGGHYLLYIVDNGKGMPPDIVESYNYAFLHGVEPRGTKTNKRIGLFNVHSRIYAHFGSPYGLTIKKSTDTGTVIEIRLPLVEDLAKKEVAACTHLSQ